MTGPAAPRDEELRGLLAWADLPASMKIAADFDTGPEVFEPCCASAGRVQRIREMHADHRGVGWCDGDDMPWPCPTIRALDGDRT